MGANYSAANPPTITCPGGSGGVFRAAVGAVTGITISNEQLAFAKNRIAMAGLQDKVDFKFCDYRDLTEKYDRIVSIEMFEAVGESYWPTYFDQVHACLKPGGKAGLQIITIAKERFDSYRKKTDFIQRYIFPGGMLPSPERLDAEFASADLKLVAREDFAADYARTLAEWRHRFLEVWPEVHALGFDERFRTLSGTISVKPSRTDLAQGRTILLVDDVVTSGATMAAATMACYAAGAEDVRILVLARVAKHT